MGRNIPSGDFPGGNFPGESFMGGNFPGGNFPRAGSYIIVFLISRITSCNISLCDYYFWPYLYLGIKRFLDRHGLNFSTKMSCRPKLNLVYN